MPIKKQNKPNVNEVFPTHVEVIQNMLEQSKSIRKNGSHQEKINSLYTKLEDGYLSPKEYEETLSELDNLRREKATNPNANGRVVIQLPKNVKSMDELEKTFTKEDAVAKEIEQKVKNENEQLVKDMKEIQNQIDLNNRYIGKLSNQKNINDIAKSVVEGKYKYYEVKQFYSDYMWLKATGLLSEKTNGKSIINYPNFN